jgi:hypothetical protein
MNPFKFKVNQRSLSLVDRRLLPSGRFTDLTLPGLNRHEFITSANVLLLEELVFFDLNLLWCLKKFFVFDLLLCFLFSSGVDPTACKIAEIVFRELLMNNFFLFLSMLGLCGFRCALEPEVCLPNEHSLVVTPCGYNVLVIVGEFDLGDVGGVAEVRVELGFFNNARVLEQLYFSVIVP